MKISAEVLRSIQRREKRKLRKRRGAMSVLVRKDSAEAVSEVVVWGDLDLVDILVLSREDGAGPVGKELGVERGSWVLKLRICCDRFLCHIISKL